MKWWHYCWYSISAFQLGGPLPGGPPPKILLIGSLSGSPPGGPLGGPLGGPCYILGY